jgi:TonB family protein
MGHSNIRLLPLLAGVFIVAIGAVPAWAADSLPVPNAANGCGRLQRVRLNPVIYTRQTAPYPEEAQERGQSGQTILRLVIDKYGFARQADVVVSSGYAMLDQAAIDSIKDHWRWEPPPPECRENGVVIREDYIWGLRMGPGSKDKPSEIYLDDIRRKHGRAKKAARAKSNTHSCRTTSGQTRMSRPAPGLQHWMQRLSPEYWIGPSSQAALHPPPPPESSVSNSYRARIPSRPRS